MYIHVYIHVYMYQLFMLYKQWAQIQLLLNHSYSWWGGGGVRGLSICWFMVRKTGLLHYYFSVHEDVNSCLE